MRCEDASGDLGRIGFVSMKTFYELKLEHGFGFKYLGDLFAIRIGLTAVEGAGFHLLFSERSCL